MSRSKRRPYVTASGKHQQKRWASRRFRKKVRQILHVLTKGQHLRDEIFLRYFCEWHEDEHLIKFIGDEEPELLHPKWMTQPATVCDFRFYSPWDEGAYRK